MVQKHIFQTFQCIVTKQTHCNLKCICVFLFQEPLGFLDIQYSGSAMVTMVMLWSICVTIDLCIVAKFITEVVRYSMLLPKCVLVTFYTFCVFCFACVKSNNLMTFAIFYTQSVKLKPHTSPE